MNVRGKWNERDTKHICKGIEVNWLVSSIVQYVMKGGPGRTNCPHTIIEKIPHDLFAILSFRNFSFCFLAFALIVNSVHVLVLGRPAWTITFLIAGCIQYLFPSIIAVKPYINLESALQIKKGLARGTQVLLPSRRLPSRPGARPGARRLSLGVHH